jgi:hypothetical protein
LPAQFVIVFEPVTHAAQFIHASISARSTTSSPPKTVRWSRPSAMR